MGRAPGKACNEAAMRASARHPFLGGDLDPLPRSFYARPVLDVARDCIGKLLVFSGERVLVGRIVEAEAYRGPRDRAAHSFGGRRTARTEVMFGPAGHAYIFMLYGLHYNLNLVTGRVGEPEAVLVRAVEPVMGVDVMAQRRNGRRDDKVLTNGPGKLCQAFGITMNHYGLDLTQGALTLSEGSASSIERSRRIGIESAGTWANKPWRFFEKGNVYVSHPRRKQP